MVSAPQPVIPLLEWMYDLYGMNGLNITTKGKMSVHFDNMIFLLHIIYQKHCIYVYHPMPIPIPIKLLL